MAKKTVKEIYPGLEPLANEFLAAAAENGFQTDGGRALAHASAMTLSTAISFRRIATALEKLTDEKNSNGSIVAQLRDMATGLRHLEDILNQPPSKDLMETLDRIAKSNEFVAQHIVAERTAVPEQFFGEGPDGTVKADTRTAEESLRQELEADYQRAISKYDRGFKRKSLLERVANFFVPMSRND
jgi:hypothetical protein